MIAPRHGHSEAHVEGSRRIGVTLVHQPAEELRQLPSVCKLFLKRNQRKTKDGPLCSRASSALLSRDLFQKERHPRLAAPDEQFGKVVITVPNSTLALIAPEALDTMKPTRCGPE